MTAKAYKEDPKKSKALEALEQQLADLTQALQRERADATNLRRRHEEEMASLRTLLKANVVRDLLPVIDNFERALKHVPKELEHNDFTKGVQGIVKQFEKTLADLGVERIKTTQEPFDPEFHEAVSMDVSSEVSAEGSEEGGGTREIVSEELQPGYRLGDTVIRHAMVRVRLEH